MGKELFIEEFKMMVVQYVLEGHTRRETSEKCLEEEKLRLRMENDYLKMNALIQKREKYKCPIL